MKLASEHPFPYGWPKRVVYFTVSAGFEPQQIRTRDEMRHRTDLFLIDKPELLAAAIGMEVPVA